MSYLLVFLAGATISVAAIERVEGRSEVLGFVLGAAALILAWALS